jgi:hypothetical protein
MDYGAFIEDAYGYTKDGVFQRGGRWLKLILAVILIGIPLNGWILRIYRGERPAPEVDRWGTLCLDGFKLLIIGLIYSIPIIILTVIRYILFPGLSGGSPFGDTMVDGGADVGRGIALFGLILVIQLVYDIFLALIMPIAAIRFARTGSFAEAFNFGEILSTIRKIGWLGYILAVILITLVIAIPVVILAVLIVLAGAAAGHILVAIGVLLVILLIIAPPLVTLQARYMTQVYDQGEPAAVPAGSQAAPAP